jgi:hypothetical protein
MGENRWIPSWLSENLSMSSYVDGTWDRQPLQKLSEDSFEKTTRAKAVIHIRIKQDMEDTVEGRSVYIIDAKVSADHKGNFSGLKLNIPVETTLECVWKPHLAPDQEMTIGDKAFRSPAIIMEGINSRMALIPDLNSMKERKVSHIMDYVKEGHELYYGLCEYKETGHVYYKLNPESQQIKNDLSFRFYMVRWEKAKKESKRDFRSIEAFLWERFAGTTMKMNQSPMEIMNSLEIYPRYAYEWALDRWQDVCWQQFKIGEKQVGGVVFIVTAKQKPGMGMEHRWREPKSLWNQAWFCSLRTAYGYWQAGHKYNRPDWTAKTEMALEFALSAPQINGLFPGYYQAGDNNKWETGQWYMSGPRRPADHEDYVHLLDSSWTCFWLLKWYKDVNNDDRILSYVNNYVERLITLQREDGGYPAWINPDAMVSSPYLIESPETSIHAMLLCLLYEVDSEKNYITQAEKACAYVLNHIVPEGRWEDFETYWSCSKEWSGKKYGVRDERSGLYNQCNFGMYWTAEALKLVYQCTGKKSWLDAGERLLAEISLFQQIWEPDYLPVPTLGGFGVMNSDDEWNDARQSLFALMYYDYYRLTGNESYLTRSMWAMKASFYMMYCSENRQVMELYNQVHPHFDEQDYGFHMENFNHHDGTSVNGLGEFTIFDWGCGAASSAYLELTAKLYES